jgi:hypothetical protein
LGGAAAGLAVAGLVLAARSAGLLAGVPAVLLAVVAVLAVPTSRQLSRRVLWAGCLLAGWLPLLWWWRLPTAGLGRTAWALAVLVGGLTGWVAAGPVRPRLARLLPDVRAVDLVVPLIAALQAWVLRAWLAADAPLPALSLLSSSFDAGMHDAFTQTVRRGGAVVPALGPAPDGTAWLGATYPQPFHVLAAAVTELLHGPTVSDPGRELVRHVHAVALLLIAAAAVVAAGMVALPVLRRRPVLGWPTAAIGAGAFVLGPGADAVLRGHWPFLLTVTAAVAAALGALQTGLRIRPLPAAAVGGAVVAVAHGWGLLGCVAVPAAVLAALPVARRRWAGRGWTAATVVVVVTAAVAAGAVLVWLRSGDAAVVASALGWVQVEPPWLLALVLAGGAVVSALLGRRRPGGVVQRRLVWWGATPVLGLSAVAALVVVQIRVTGSVGYYGAKLLAGVFLAVLPVAAVVAAHLLDDVLPAGAVLGAGGGRPGGRHSLPATAAGLGLALVAVLAWAATGGGLQLERISWQRAASPDTRVTALAHAAAVQQRRPFGTVLYLTTGPGKNTERFADAWFMALTGTASQGRAAVVQAGDPLVWEQPAKVPGLVRGYLSGDPRRSVVVRPEDVDRVRRSVGDATLAARITTW